MSKFDLKAYATLLGQGSSALGALGTVFGVPSCLMNLGMDVLKLLPTPILFGIREEMNKGVAMANGVVKSIQNQIRNLLGIIEWDTEEGGFKFISNSSKFGNDAGLGGFLSDLGGFVEGIAALGGELWANYNATLEQIERIKECLNSFLNYKKFQDGNGSSELAKLGPQAYEEYINKEYLMQKEAMRQALDAINSFNNTIADIEDIIFSQSNGTIQPPVLSCQGLSYLSGTSLATDCLPPTPEVKSVFRLVYGPPRSTVGQFILSKDGIYFDSQASGIIPALVYLDSKKSRLNEFRENKWTFSQDPSLGGRGDGFSTKNLQLYFGTLLDPTIIEDSLELAPYYDNDKFLQELILNKNKRIYDLSSQISELESGDAPESVIYNLKQSLISENGNHLDKINKRKKQIELAVKIPLIYTQTRIFNAGEVPVNDFSYLAGLNITLDLQKQKALTFSQVDIDSVVSPLQLSSTQVVSVAHSKQSTMDHLILTELSDGAIIFDGSSVSATDAVILPAESFISTDSLIAMYNFLDTDVEVPSSINFSNRNSIAEKIEDYGQLVGGSQQEIFRNGLGIPFLQGITKQSSTNPIQASAVGSFFRLPSTKKFNDLLYNKNGATIDFWVHMPSLQSIEGGYDSGQVSSLYRLVLSNENTGYFTTVAANASQSIINDFGDRSVRGFMLGFTRDRRLCNNLTPSNDTEDNPATESCFFLAPTQSTSPSAAGLILRDFYDSESCQTSSSYHAMVSKLNDTSLTKSFSSCEQEFCHVAVTFDPKEDLIKFYLDSNLVTTSSISYVFGIPKYKMPNLPTFKRGNSFEYNTSSVGPDAPEDLKYGPKLDNYFTPWIVGGGYTDGMYYNGNFLGGSYGGIISGLKGYLGSLKFYSRALRPEEILNNYKAQKEFFKKINTAYLGWEEIVST